MKFSDVLQYALGNLGRRRSRTLLTASSVAIGIAAIVALLSITQGMQSSIQYELQDGLGMDTLILSQSSDKRMLVLNDTSLLDGIEHVTAVVPVLHRTGVIQVNNTSRQVAIMGIDFEEYGEVYSHLFLAERGSIPVAPENTSVIIGMGLYDPSNNGTILADVGDTMTIINGYQSYDGNVTAVLNEIGSLNIGGMTDGAIYIPVEQARQFFGSDYVSSMIVQIDDYDQATIDGVTQEVRDRFDGQVNIASSLSVMKMVSQVFVTVDLFLICVGVITLMVAGIGIMNIMLMSLIERTREIGTLKALGMKDRTVLTIFLLEAGIIGIIGSVIGAISGFLLAQVISTVIMGSGMLSTLSNSGAYFMSYMEIVPELSLEIFLGAILFGMLVSIIFALYPAWRSSKLSPVEALRHL